MPEEGRYIYCIINADGRREFGPIGIGGHGDQVHSVCYRELAAVISSTKTMKYPVSRPNTIAHQRVMEEVMKDHVILPVRFDTIAESKKKRGVLVETHEQRIITQVLKSPYREFEDLLEEMSDKIELGVKGLWQDMDTIYAEIVRENTEVARLNRRVKKMPSVQSQAERVRLGEMVKRALDEKKRVEESRVLGALKGLPVDWRQNKTFGDRMFMNDAFLIETRQERGFDAAIDELNERYDGRMIFKYFGPVPLCNFVEIVVTWED